MGKEKRRVKHHTRKEARRNPGFFYIQASRFAINQVSSELDSLFPRSIPLMKTKGKQEFQELPEICVQLTGYDPIDSVCLGCRENKTQHRGTKMVDFTKRTTV